MRTIWATELRTHCERAWTQSGRMGVDCGPRGSHVLFGQLTFLINLLPHQETYVKKEHQKTKISAVAGFPVVL